MSEIKSKNREQLTRLRLDSSFHFAQAFCGEDWAVGQQLDPSSARILFQRCESMSNLAVASCGWNRQYHVKGTLQWINNRVAWTVYTDNTVAIIAVSWHNNATITTVESQKNRRNESAHRQSGGNVVHSPDNEWPIRGEKSDSDWPTIEQLELRFATDRASKSLAESDAWY